VPPAERTRFPFPPEVEAMKAKAAEEEDETEDDDEEEDDQEEEWGESGVGKKRGGSVTVSKGDGEVVGEGEDGQHGDMESRMDDGENVVMSHGAGGRGGERTGEGAGERARAGRGWRGRGRGRGEGGGIGQASGRGAVIPAGESRTSSGSGSEESAWYPARVSRSRLVRGRRGGGGNGGE